MSYSQIYLKNNIRIYVNDLTAVAQEGANRHQVTPLVALVLGTAIVTLAPIAIIKQHGRISAMIKTDGAIKTIIVEATASGDVRALIGNAAIYTEHDNSNYNYIPLKLALGEAGTLKVVHEYKKDSFGGEVPLVKNDIVTDTAYYFAQSEQIFTAIVADVNLSDPQTFQRAYSVIFQMLPGHSELDVLWVEEFIKTHQLSKLGINAYAKALNAQFLAEHTLQWKCTCTLERMKELINLLSPKEQDEILHEQGKIEVTCNFCNNKYVVKA